MSTLSVNAGPGLTTVHDATITPGNHGSADTSGLFNPNAASGGVSIQEILGGSGVGGGAGWGGAMVGNFGGSAVGGGSVGSAFSITSGAAAGVLGGGPGGSAGSVGIAAILGGAGFGGGAVGSGWSIVAPTGGGSGSVADLLGASLTPSPVPAATATPGVAGGGSNLAALTSMATMGAQLIASLGALGTSTQPTAETPAPTPAPGGAGAPVAPAAPATGGGQNPF